MKKIANSSKLSKGVSRDALAPVSTCNLPKLKRRPRGKPFPKNHQFGLATRFQPGQSGNPSGKPRNAEIGKAIRARLSEVAPHDAHQRTFAELLADAWIAQGLDGNVAALASLTDRAEGRAAVSIELSDGPDPIADLIAEMRLMSQQRGRPEGMIPYDPDRTEEDSEFPQLPS